MNSFSHDKVIPGDKTTPGIATFASCKLINNS